MNWKRHIKQGLISGLAFGFGLLAGDAISLLIFKVFPIGELGLPDAIALVVGILLALLISGLGGAVGGFIGGWTLPVVGKLRERKRGYAWKSAISIGIFYGGLLFSALLLISLIGLFYVVDTPPDPFVTTFAIVGAVFGLLAGFLLGLLTVGLKKSGGITLASFLGFGIGGAGLGYGLWVYLFSVFEGSLGTGQFWWFLLGLLFFGLVGGAALGFEYSYLSDRITHKEKISRSSVFVLAMFVGVAILVVLGINALQPLFDYIEVLLIPRSAGLSSTMVSDTVGTHWASTQQISVSSNVNSDKQPDISANEFGQVALVWLEDSPTPESMLYMGGIWDDENRETYWEIPVKLESEQIPSSSPQVALDNFGSAHVVWRSGETILYSVCEPEGCNEALVLPGSAGLSCDVSPDNTPDLVESGQEEATIAASRDDAIMVAWQNREGSLLYGIWDASETPTTASVRCVNHGEAGIGSKPSLAGGPNKKFEMVFERKMDSENGIYVKSFRNDSWASDSIQIGKGNLPDIHNDTDDQIHVSWCGENGEGIFHWQEGSENEVSALSCKSLPKIAQDSDGRIHIVWFGDTVSNILDKTTSDAIVYESIQDDDGWSTASIVSQTSSNTQPVIANDGEGILHLAWSDAVSESSGMFYTHQVQYDCDKNLLDGISKVVYEASQLGGYHPEEDIAYCQNQYERLLYTPFSRPEFSDDPVTPYGAFDDFSELIKSAEYEVLFVIMEYDEDISQDSPGILLSDAITELYFKVKENPEAYPRGMTVKVLLGNVPRPFAMELNSDLWRVLENLRKSGLPEMLNEDIGWRLEVANYGGSWPHSHVKSLIIDGKHTVATGFNYQYHHFIKDHPSGKGQGTLDIGILMTGPIAQDTRLVFNELWKGAVQRQCTDLQASYPLWQISCHDTKTTVEHVPEVMRYYLPEGDSTAFSMFRNMAFAESDDQITAALASSEERMDVIQAMFTLEMVCTLNFLYDVCTINNALPYMVGILNAVEKNNSQARLLIKFSPLLGVENAVALDILEREVIKRGLEELVEVRKFPGELHAKTALIDEEFLIIGSQNYNYSAFGEGDGLAEYNFGTDDPEAIEDYLRMFEYYWDLAGQKE